MRDTAAADFQRWPVAAQGVFTANLEFDEAGHWEIQVDTATADGKAVTARGATQVRPETSTPAIGQPAPASMTPTGDQVDDLAAITSSPQPDPGLYRLSVHEALGAGKPLVLAFATPAFCLTATCGPQVAIMSQLKDRYPERANFIHVEVFENPHLMEEGRPSGGLVKAVSEWNLPTEPWDFRHGPRRDSPRQVRGLCHFGGVGTSPGKCAWGLTSASLRRGPAASLLSPMPPTRPPSRT